MPGEAAKPERLPSGLSEPPSQALTESEVTPHSMTLNGSGDAMMELYRNPKIPVPDYSAMDPFLMHIAFVSDDPQKDRDRLMAAGASLVDDYSKTPAGDELVMPGSTPNWNSRVVAWPRWWVWWLKNCSTAAWKGSTRSRW